MLDIDIILDYSILLLNIYSRGFSMYIQFIPLTFTLAVLLKSLKKYRSAS